MLVRWKAVNNGPTNLEQWLIRTWEGQDQKPARVTQARLRPWRRLPNCLCKLSRQPQTGEGGLFVEIVHALVRDCS